MKMEENGSDCSVLNKSLKLDVQRRDTCMIEVREIKSQCNWILTHLEDCVS